MMYWVSEEFYLSFVVTPVCLCHLPLLANSDGLSKVCAVVGIGSWFQVDLAYHPSVCSHFYSWGSAWWVWRRPGCILQLPNDCTNRLDCELVQETESTFPGELSTFEHDIDEINQFECEEVRERTLSEDEFETDTFMYERFVVDDDEAGSDIFRSV